MYSDEQIKSFINKAYKEISDNFEVFGVFLKGSQNYGLATETSDVDLVVVVIPSFHDLACEQIHGYFLDSFEKKSETEYGTIQIVGIRDFMRQLLKPNIANHEFLVTQYCIFNDKYAGYWLGGIVKYREKLLKHSINNLVRSTVGCGYEAIKQAFPNDASGNYVPKRLVFAMCCLDYIKNVLDDNKSNPFIFDNLDEMRELKEHPVDYDDAITIRHSLEEGFEFYKKFIGDIVYNPSLNEGYLECQEIVCSTLENILRDSLTHQLLSGGNK